MVSEASGKEGRCQLVSDSCALHRGHVRRGCVLQQGQAGRGCVLRQGHVGRGRALHRVQAGRGCVCNEVQAGRGRALHQVQLRLEFRVRGPSADSGVQGRQTTTRPGHRVCAATAWLSVRKVRSSHWCARQGLMSRCQVTCATTRSRVEVTCSTTPRSRVPAGHVDQEAHQVSRGGGQVKWDLLLQEGSEESYTVM